MGTNDRVGRRTCGTNAVRFSFVVALSLAWLTPAFAAGHWAFEPRTRPPVPEIRDQQSGTANPIDAFIVTMLKKERLALLPEADRRSLIRRLSLDLP